MLYADSIQNDFKTEAYANVYIDRVLDEIKQKGTLFSQPVRRACVNITIDGCKVDINVNSSKPACVIVNYVTRNTAVHGSLEVKGVGWFQRTRPDFKALGMTATPYRSEVELEKIKDTPPSQAQVWANNWRTKRRK